MPINSPLDIPGCILWLSAQQLSSDLIDGASVTTWSDLSGEGNDATYVAGSGLGPILDVDGGPTLGPAVRFQDAGYLRFPLALVDEIPAGEAVIYTKADAGNRGLWNFGHTAQSNSSHYTYSNGIYETFGLDTANSRVIVSGMSANATSWSRYGASSVEGAQVLRMNNSVIGTGAFACGWPNPTQVDSPYPMLGRSTFTPTGQHHRFSGLVSLFVMYDRLLTTTERADLDAWALVNPSGGVLIVPNPPTDLAVSNITSNSLTLDWEVPTPTPDGYEYRINGEESLTTSGTSVDISDLSPETLYTLEVRSYLGSLFSDWASIATGTLAVVPPPVNLESVGVSFSGFSVFWDPPNDPNAVVPEMYEYRVNAGPPVNVGLAEDVELTGLNPGSSYLFEIRSRSGADFSSWASLNVQTSPLYAKIAWSPLNPRYHHGVDQGVLYPLDGPGVAWNGLVSVEDVHVGGEFESIYMDGIKRLNLPSGRSYQAVLSAYSTPEEFGPCNGEIEVIKGLILTRQPRQRFGFSYRTMVGDLGYQIHLVYNALATPTGRGHQTKTDSPTPNVPTWTIDAVPISSSAPRPTSHYILDSTKIGEDQMVAIESLLYGADDRIAYLPSIGQIAAIATNWDPQIVIPNYVSGLNSLEDGMGDVQETDVNGVYISIPTGRLTETEVKGLFQLTE